MLDKDNMDFRVGDEVAHVKPIHKAFVKGKKVLACAKASQTSTIGAADRDQGSSVAYS